MREPRWLRPVFLLLLAFWVLEAAGVDIAVDWMWFQSLGFLPVFERILGLRVGMWLLAFVLSAAFVALNMRVAVRWAPMDLNRLDAALAELRPGPRRLQAILRIALGAAVVLPALMVAAMTGGAWQTVMLWLGRVPWGEVDPVFGRDLGFFVFTLPVLQLMQAAGMATLMLTLMPVGAWYVLRDIVGMQRQPSLSAPARRHLLVLASLGMLLAGFGAWLSRYQALYDHHGVVWGAGYADVSARIPGLTVVAVLSVAAAAGLVFAAGRRGWTLPGGILVGWFVLRATATGFLPTAVQDWYVGPNELQLEREFLQRNIDATNKAYALDRIEVKPFDADADLTSADLAANPGTVDNIRVWDDRPLLTTYGQLQEIRLYYDFNDVDIDRYTIDGRVRQVMLSARELNTDRLPVQARSWVNEHFQYTHGYGATMSPVNVVTREGLPELMIRDIPPELDPALVRSGLQIDRPEVYYGELTDKYVFVRTGAQEFDYPLGDDNAYTTYAGDGGVPIGGLARKALFSAHFGNLDILLSQYLTADSRVMFRRRVRDRVQHLAPFLRYDRDPYMVIVGGRILWVIDGYTTAGTYPYSEPAGTTSDGRFNYMRNSVKAVVDAYDGRVTLYIADDQDPIIKAWAKALPGAFASLADMPEELRAHVRYPEDFFNVQASMYKAYHMTDSTVFYNKEDMWDLPTELYAGQDQAMESYYLIMKLPGEDSAEFILLVPFVPTNRDNMISWLAARCDPDHYGKLILYQFPKQKLIYGPRQIESRIDQDPVISQQITLWSQSGSRVVRGNLLVIPIGDSLMYVEPLYLQAESSQLPELKRVIVSFDNRIAMEESLADALQVVFGGGSGTASTPTDDTRPAAEGSPDAAGWQDLAARAQTELQQAIEAQRAGDWAGYGDALDALEHTIGDLVGASASGQDDEDAPAPGAVPGAEGSPEPPAP